LLFFLSNIVDLVEVQDMEGSITTHTGGAGRMKFIAGGLLIVAAVVYLIATSTQANAQYFLTVDELAGRPAEASGREVRVSGAVIGESIQYDPQSLTLRFTVAHVPGDNKDIEAQGGLAAVLHAAVTDPNRSHLQVIYKNQPRPDLLRNEAQAIMTGKVGEDGIFYAEELLLKCPTKYEEDVPGQAEG
jgi:cytochrome c-type biogenesis protein CcmE